MFSCISQYSFNCGELDAYSCFAERLGLIFDESVYNDFPIRKGYIDNEYYLTGNIDLEKYLLGINDSGLEIKRNLKVLYYFFKYYNHEITLDTFLFYTGLVTNSKNKEIYDLKNLPNIAEVVDCMYWAEYLPHFSKECKIEFLVNPPEYYVNESPIFNDVKRLADDYGVKLYDIDGIRIIDKEARIEEVRQMMAYLKEQLDRTEEERKAYVITKFNVRKDIK